jgi:putative serine protease PepD
MWNPPQYRPYPEVRDPAFGAPQGMQPPPLPPPVPPTALSEPPVPPRRRKTAAVAAVALVAALAGGTGGVLIGHDMVGGSTTAAATTGTTTEQASAKLSSGTISAIAANVLPSVVEVTVKTSSGESIGSGVILSSTGEILTNNHVVSDASDGTLSVTFSNGKTADATVVGTSPSSDLAVIKATGVSGLTPAVLGDSSTVKVGDGVVAIGAPEGLQNTVTSGIVSYLNRKVTVQSDSSGSGSDPWGNPTSLSDSSGTVSYNAIQTDAAINPGNSGGPLINAAGQVIAINSAMYSPTSSQSSQGGSVGLGFAIPINKAKSIISQLEAGHSS